MIHHLVLILVLYIMPGIVRAQCNVEGYYWRDFKGKIPPDALPGGTDIDGIPIYIGQAIDPGTRYLIPAKIYSNDRRAYYEFGGGEHSVTDHIKILCTQYPNDFQWVKTDTSDIKVLTDKHIIIGGYEPGITTYIGRARQGGEVLIGKVLTDHYSFFDGLHITFGGKKARHTTYEVLTYNPTTTANAETSSNDLNFSESCPSKIYHIEMYNL